VSLAYSLAVLDGKREILAIVSTASPRRRIAGPCAVLVRPSVNISRRGIPQQRATRRPWRTAARL